MIKPEKYTLILGINTTTPIQINEERVTLFVLPLRMKRVDSCASRVIAIRNM